MNLAEIWWEGMVGIYLNQVKDHFLTIWLLTAILVVVPHR